MKKWASDDMELFAKLKKGDRTAIDGIYYKYHDTVFALAYSFLGDAAAAKDAAAETYVKLWLRRDNLEEAGHIRGFLFTVTKNYCLNELRSRKFSEAVKRQLIPKTEESPYAADRKLARSEVVAKIYKEIKRLPTKTLQDVFVLRFIEGKEPSEIATIMGLPLKSVYNYVENSRRKMKVLLQAEGLDLSCMLLIISLSTVAAIDLPI